MQAHDIASVSAIRVNGWKSAYSGLIPKGYLDSLTIADDIRVRREMFARSGSGVENFVAETDGTVVGWAALGPSREGDRLPDDGELLALYARPDLIGRGIGKALMNHILASAEQRPFGRIVLWVIEGNTRARTFYEAAGFAADGTTGDWSVDGSVVQEVRYCLRLSQAA